MPLCSRRTSPYEHGMSRGPFLDCHRDSLLEVVEATSRRLLLGLDARRRPVEFQDTERPSSRYRAHALSRFARVGPSMFPKDMEGQLRGGLRR